MAEARGVLDRDLKLPPGYFVEWGGQFENLERPQQRLALVVPLTLLLIFVLLWFSLKHAARRADHLHRHPAGGGRRGLRPVAARHPLQRQRRRRLHRPGRHRRAQRPGHDRRHPQLPR
ncbi:MAG: efflux RND transporter permease subunit [Desulfomicrobium escambiense]|nr:efflux RND transporter permease subunit [Desulfomicrobium escambiense]